MKDIDNIQKSDVMMVSIKLITATLCLLWVAALVGGVA